VERELGAVQVLVLNAGIFVVEELETTSLESWRRTLDVNLTGAFLCARRALPTMRASGWGRVIAIGSSAGKTGGSKAMAAYAASKAGVMALAKSIASEYARSGVTANALAPSLIDTPMIAGIADLASRIPVGRLGQPKDVADLVTFLASDHAGYITGEVVDVNGGFLID
jgi:NAD(P)-dependent dehydrogenase (short-subunit alcohol dehydrogenase family)